MSIVGYAEWFVKIEEVLLRWYPPADRDVPSDVSSDSLTKSQIRGLTPDRLKEMFSDSTETYTLPVVETIVNGAPSYTDFYLVRKALEDVHGYMGDWTTEVLETDRIMDGLDGFAKEATLDYLDDEVIRTVLNNQMFFKLFIIDPDVLNGALSHFSGLHRQNFSELFKLRVTYQVRQKLAKAVVSEPEAISITEGEWEAIDKWPEILNNALFIKLVQGNSDIANTVLGNMPQWQTLVELGLFPKKLDEEVTHAVKGFGGGLGGDPVKRNTSYLWIPEPGRTGGGGTAQTNPNTTADEMSSENLRYAQELSGSGAFNVKFTGKGIHPKYGYEKIVRFLEQGDDPWCQDLWLIPLQTPRGRALTVAEMLLPMADSVDQTKSFFTEDLVSVASLKMKKYEGDTNTIEYIKNAETRYEYNVVGGYMGLFKSDVTVFDDPGMLSSLLSLAYKRFLTQVVKLPSDDVYRPTMLTEWNSMIETLSEEIYPIILQNIENAFRVAMWQSFRLYRQSDARCGVDGPGAQTEDEIEQAANEGLKNNKDPAVEQALVEDDLNKGIEGRQNFFKQCALMRNLERLKGEFIRRLENEVKETKGKPFDGRFFMAKSLVDQGKIINNLVSSRHSATFFEIPPSVLSSLVPKVKLYRVYEDSGKIKETEFIFPQSTDIDKQKNFTNTEDGSTKSFLSSTFDKGDGVGLKDFSFSFNGTNPAESRNDITANLTLFFQSFGDFVKERVSSDGGIYRFVDLVIQPVKKDRINLPVVHANQYDPSFYRIRAEIGYVNPRENLSKLTMPGFGANEMEQLDLAIQNTNKSYYLNMVDHDITVNPDGSVEIKIAYRAYIESAMKSPRFDAMATPAIIRKKRQNSKNLQDLLATGRCSQQMLSEFKATMDAEETILRKRSLQSIIRRLFDRKKIYNCKINPGDANHFRDNGYFKTCRLEPTHTETPCGGRKNNNSATDFILSSIGVPDVEDFDFLDEDDTIIQYFFFGDLLYTVMDSMYDRVNGKIPTPGAENMSIILGSFDLDAFGKQVKGVNVAEIPISVDYFMTWYTNNVLVKGTTRKTFPILDFIRNLSNKLLQKTMLESCSNVALVNNLRFHTGQLMSYSEDGVDPLRKIVGWKKDNPNLFVMCDGDDVRRDVLPLKGDSSSVVKVSNFFNYMFLNVVGSNLTYTGSGKYEEDINDGRFHIHIGSNRGIVKTISFDKTDMEYVREARMFQNGIDGLLQLSNVYTVTVEMFGNTIFYPGMELYINPYGIGGTIMGSPTQGRDTKGVGASIANKLGFGGYHTVVGVDSTIAPGKFSTTVRAQWYYAGDGITPADRNGTPPAAEEEKIDPLSGSADNQPGGFCSNAVVAMQDDVIDLANGGTGMFTISDVPETRAGTEPAPEVDPNDFTSDPVEQLPELTAPEEEIRAADSADSLYSDAEKLTTGYENQRYMKEQRDELDARAEFDIEVGSIERADGGYWRFDDVLVEDSWVIYQKTPGGYRGNYFIAATKKTGDIPEPGQPLLDPDKMNLLLSDFETRASAAGVSILIFRMADET